MSQSELSCSVMNATEIPLQHQINAHSRVQPQALHHIFQTAGGGATRENNAFSVSGQKVVHFKEVTGIENHLSEDRP